MLKKFQFFTLFLATFLTTLVFVKTTHASSLPPTPTQDELDEMRRAGEENLRKYGRGPTEPPYPVANLTVFWPSPTPTPTPAPTAKPTQSLSPTSSLANDSTNSAEIKNQEKIQLGTQQQSQGVFIRVRNTIANFFTKIFLLFGSK